VRYLTLGILLTTVAVSSPNRSVTQSRGGSVRIVLSAPARTYLHGAAVPITISIQSLSSHPQPFRWGCGHFAILHIVGARGRDLGVAPLASGPPCMLLGAVGMLPPHHTWTTVQVIRLTHRYIAAQFSLRVHNVDGPGSVDLLFFARPLVFRFAKPIAVGKAVKASTLPLGRSTCSAAGSTACLSLPYKPEVYHAG